MTYEYAIGTLFAGAGVVAVSDFSVVGSGTQFTTEMAAGDFITVGATTRVVSAVTSGSTLTTSALWPIVQNDQPFTRVRLANLESGLNLPAPHGVYTPYARPIPLGNGGVRGAGWATAEWRWGYLARLDRDALRTYCPGASAEVYLCTNVNDDADDFRYFHGWLVWPQFEEPWAGRRLDFTLRFQALIQWF